MAKLDYKQKYLALRSKILRSTDVSFRLGFEQGMKEAQMQNLAQSQQAMQAQQMAQQGQMPQDGQSDMSPDQFASQMQSQDQQDVNADQPQEGGTELDQHINELQNLVKKGERPSLVDIRTIANKMSEKRKAQQTTIKGNEKVQTMQKKLVDSIIGKWDQELKEDSDLSFLFKSDKE